MSKNKQDLSTNGLPILKEGYLRKTGKFESSNWKKRYFIIFGHLLSTFDSPPAVGKKVKSKKRMDLFGAKIMPHQNSAGNTGLFLFSIIQTGGKSLTLRANDVEEMQDWVVSLVQASTYRPRSQSCCLFSGGQVRSSLPSQPSASTSVPKSASNSVNLSRNMNQMPLSHSLPSNVQRVNSESSANQSQYSRKQKNPMVEESYFLPSYSSSSPNHLQNNYTNNLPRYDNYSADPNRNFAENWNGNTHNNLHNGMNQSENANWNAFSEDNRGRRSESLGGRIQSGVSYPELASFLRMNDSDKERDLIQQRLNTYNGGREHVYQSRNPLFSC
eukprot:TRINITY_DN3820_c0_g1_i1.p1 TRINITY_DN3820_c0_g1~~TRINITY_DN3820_c0_g1_i1.p1  ORF type:complete len:378 (+),score=104.01 TRINITY_DN3820_c0_g1_i1:148-1134(+)